MAVRRAEILRQGKDVVVFLDIGIVCVPYFVGDGVEDDLCGRRMDEVFVLNQHEVLNFMRYIVEEVRAFSGPRLKYINIAPVQVDVVVGQDFFPLPIVFLHVIDRVELFG